MESNRIRIKRKKEKRAKIELSFTVLWRTIARNNNQTNIFEYSSNFCTVVFSPSTKRNLWYFWLCNTSCQLQCHISSRPVTENLAFILRQNVVFDDEDNIAYCRMQTSCPTTILHIVGCIMWSLKHTISDVKCALLLLYRIYKNMYVDKTMFILHSYSNVQWPLKMEYIRRNNHESVTNK